MVLAAFRRLLSLSALACCLAYSLPVRAQEEAPEDEDAGDVIVTARRIEERLQDVPISITFFDQEQLTKRNIVSAGDIATYTPSLSSNGRFGSENTSFAIRGFTQDTGTAPSVGVYFADVPALRAGAIGTTLANGAGVGAQFDLENVQILKGPQGTLFGRNTTGGAVLLVPQRPSFNFEGYVEGSVGNHEMKRIQAVVNVPLSDSIRLRLGVDRQTREGYLRNHSGIGPKDFADIDYWALRGSIVVDLTPDLENYLIATYSDSDTNGFLPRLFACDPASSRPEAPLACDQIARQNARGDGPYDVENATIAPRQRIRQWQVINTTSWTAADWLTIKNIASYGEFRESFRASVFGENLLLPSGPNAGRSLIRVQASPFPGRDSAAQSTFTEELQLQGLGDRLVWQAGAYLELSDPIGFSGPLSPSYALCTSPDTLLCTGSGIPGARPTASARSHRTSYRDYGLYAQATYRLTDRFGITAGVRYTWDRTKDVTRQINFDPLPVTSDPPLGTCLDALTFGAPGTGANVNRTEESCETTFTQKSDKPTWVIDLEYKPTTQILLYAKYARGYRQGSVKSDASGLETFEPEKVDTYEAGVKTKFGGAIPGTFNLAAFYNDFTNQQLAASAVPCCGNPNPTPAQVIVNAGKSRIRGIEVEAAIAPLEGLEIQGSYAYLDTRLKSFTATGVSPIYNTPVLTSARVGYPLTLSPKHKFTITGTYTLPLDASIGRISIGATFTHIDKMYSTFQSTPLFLAGQLSSDLGLLPAVDLLNLNLNWESVGGLPLDIAAFATNVTKERHRVSVFGGYPSFGFEAMVPNEPRMFGLRVKYRFGR